MNFKSMTLILIVFLMRQNYGLAALKVMTTTETIKSVVKEIGVQHVEVGSFCKGTQDPHFLTAKPSFMAKTRQADLVIAIGLGLEVGWLPKVIAGGRNPDIFRGKPGYLELGSMLEVLEVPAGPVTRAGGDVHPEGNPHVDLDPVRLGKIGEIIAKRLSALNPENGKFFLNNAKKFKKRMEAKTTEWKKRIRSTGIRSVVTYHKSLTYFLDRFEIHTAALLEPLPGVSPTASHILSVIQSSVDAGVTLTLVENIFSDATAHRVARGVPGMRVVKVAVSVGGQKDITSPDELFESLVRAMEGKP